MVLFANNCQNVYEKQINFKCFQEPQIQGSTFQKVKWVEVSNSLEGQMEKWAKCRKMAIFSGLKQGSFQVIPETPENRTLHLF